MKIALQAAVAAVGLLGYLAIGWAYRSKWDAVFRTALGRRLGVPVEWRWVRDSGTLPRWAWHSDADGPLGRTLWHRTAIAVAQYATAAVLGVLPALGLLWLQLQLGLHPLIVAASAFLVIPVAALLFFRPGPALRRS